MNTPQITHGPGLPGCQQRLQSPPCKLQSMEGRVKGTLLGACRCHSLINTRAPAKINGQVKGHTPPQAPKVELVTLLAAATAVPRQSTQRGARSSRDTPSPLVLHREEQDSQRETGAAPASSRGSTTGATNAELR